MDLNDIYKKGYELCPDGVLRKPSKAQCLLSNHPKAVVQPKPARKRIRQDSKPLMNKLETEFFHWIKDQYPNYPPVRPQAKTFRLANGLRYTPDFTCSIWPDESEEGPTRETAWEIKGKHIWDDAICKLKVAATAFPEVRWLFCWKIDGKWVMQEIKP